MLRGEKVGLRARRDSDVPILHAELHDDVVVRSRASSRPWRPIPSGAAASPYAMGEPTDDAAIFTVVRLTPDEPAADVAAGDVAAGDPAAGGVAAGGVAAGGVAAGDAGADGEVAGEALLWGIDTHNRLAHIGISLRPAMRGQGLGLDVVQVLCHYGFTVRGLHRLQIETLADNTAMLRAASRAGFVPEGRLRAAAWVLGDFVDEVVLGLLTAEWSAATQ